MPLCLPERLQGETGFEIIYHNLRSSYEKCSQQFFGIGRDASNTASELEIII